MKTVVFDIDGTLTEETEFLRKYAPKFLRRKYGFKVTEVNPNGYTVAEIYDLVQLFRNIGYKQAEEKAEKVSQEFWNNYFMKYSMQPLKEGAKEIIDSFRKKGYSVHIVSMRSKKTSKKESILSIIIRKKIIPLITRKQLRKSNIKVDVLELPESIEQKMKYIQAINPKYVFEDQVNLINKAIDCTNGNTKIVCVNNPYNTNVDFPNKVIRINNYKDKKIVTMVGNLPSSNVKKYSKRKIIGSNIFYRIVKFLGSPIIFTLYRPLICGKRKIPKNKNIAFIGNHRKKSDPIILASAINQTIHWAALKRMFTGGEDLFSNTKTYWRCNMSASFLKCMGAVPIARPEDSDYHIINFKSLRFLSKQLKHGLSSIGFFPEGTLNRNFEKYDLLPLKSSHIFKTISIIGCYLQPFSIVWIPQNKTIRNKAIVIFDYPIDTQNRSEEELTAIWKNIVENNIKKANAYIDYLMKVDEEDKPRFKKYIKVKKKFRELRD